MKTLQPVCISQHSRKRSKILFLFHFYACSCERRSNSSGSKNGMIPISPQLSTQSVLIHLILRFTVSFLSTCLNIDRYHNGTQNSNSKYICSGTAKAQYSRKKKNDQIKPILASGCALVSTGMPKQKEFSIPLLYINVTSTKTDQFSTLASTESPTRVLEFA